MLSTFTDKPRVGKPQLLYNSGKPIAVVCHSPGVLRHVTYKGAPLVKGKRVTGFTNEEEAEVQLTNVVPFLVENELKRPGATFEKLPSWKHFAITDGRLITGQNTASSTSAAKALLTLLLGSEKEERRAKDGVAVKASAPRL